MTMPHSPESEYAIIGTILYDHANLRRCEALQADHFYTEIGQVFWSAIRAISQEGSPATAERLMDFLDADWFAQIGGQPLLLEVAECCVFGPEINGCVNLIIDTFQRREMIKLADRLRAEAVGKTEGYIDPSRVLAGFEGDLDTMRESASLTTKVGTAADHAESVILNTDTRPLLKTGFDTLDRRIGGFERGALSIIAARPGAGKTAFSIAMGANVATDESVGIFSLDVSHHVIKQRLALTLSHAAGNHVPTISQLREGQLSDSHRETLVTALKSEEGRRFYIDDRGGLSIHQIDHQVRAWKSAAKRSGAPPLGLVFIDHIAKVYPSQRSGSLYEKTSFASNELLELAKRHPDISFVALAQMSREGEKMKRRPIIADLRDSGKLEEDASLILLLHREEMRWALDANNEGLDNETRANAQRELSRVQGFFEIIIGKNRNGETGAVTLRHRIGNNVFFDNIRTVEKSEAFG